jgi:enterochelin esterase-like enzyme
LSIQSFDSATFHRKVDYSLYLPPCYGADATRVYPVLYLLHGARADYTQWPDLNVKPEADRLTANKHVAPFVVVMPDGDYRPGEDYAAFVLRDLMPHSESTLQVGRDRTQRAIGGLSAGGDWALYLALTHPETFGAVAAHSAVAEEAPKLLGAQAQHDLRIYLDVGSTDPLRPGMEALAATLRAKQFALVFHIYPGGHDRPYWRSLTAEYLSFYAAAW